MYILLSQSAKVPNLLISSAVAQLVSMAAAGLLADAIGARNVFILGGVIVAIAGVIAMFIFRGVELKAVEVPLAATAEVGD
jgi:Na+/melibiose symporter-like transporter